MGNNTAVFFRVYFPEVDNFYNAYLSVLDQKFFASFVKISVKKNNKILYRLFANHAPMTEPIFSEENENSGIDNIKKLKFTASSQGKNLKENPYYSPCFLNEKIKKMPINNIDSFRNLEYFCMSCKADNFVESKKFMEQIAVGTGLGLRFDLSFLLLRTDFAFPIRKPYNEDGNRWVIDQINFGSGSWRKENLVFNLAIGYPF